MTAYIISYDLRSPGRNYGALYEALQAFSSYARVLESVWIIQTHYTPVQVRDHLARFMDASDGLFVAELKAGWAARGIRTDVLDWMKNNL